MFGGPSCPQACPLWAATWECPHLIKEKPAKDPAAALAGPPLLKGEDVDACMGLLLGGGTGSTGWTDSLKRGRSTRPSDDEDEHPAAKRKPSVRFAADTIESSSGDDYDGDHNEDPPSASPFVIKHHADEEADDIEEDEEEEGQSERKSPSSTRPRPGRGIAGVFFQINKASLPSSSLAGHSAKPHGLKAKRGRGGRGGTAGKKPFSSVVSVPAPPPAVPPRSASGGHSDIYRSARGRPAKPISGSVLPKV